ncbi:hypothetical protein GJ496_007517 [Pomphorhynchus laevis]|nr:hypothetical protein GJ496_007517 [Pomphorhynchus laevis]
MARGLPVLYFTIFWTVIGAGFPVIIQFAVKPGINRQLSQVCFAMTAACCYILWLVVYLHQLNPLIGPELENRTAKVLNALWGTTF